MCVILGDTYLATQNRPEIRLQSRFPSMRLEGRFFLSCSPADPPGPLGSGAKPTLLPWGLAARPRRRPPPLGDGREELPLTARPLVGGRQSAWWLRWGTSEAPWTAPLPTSSARRERLARSVDSRFAVPAPPTSPTAFLQQQIERQKRRPASRAPHAAFCQTGVYPRLHQSRSPAFAAGARGPRFARVSGTNGFAEGKP